MYLFGCFNIIFCILLIYTFCKQSKDLVVVVVVISILCYIIQETTMLLQGSCLATNLPVLLWDTLAMVHHKKVSWLRTRKKDDRLFLQCHPRPSPFTEVASQMGITTGKVQCQQDFNCCTKRQLDFHRSGTYLEHAFKLLGGKKLRWVLAGTQY